MGPGKLFNCKIINDELLRVRAKYLVSKGRYLKLDKLTLVAW